MRTLTAIFILLGISGCHVVDYEAKSFLASDLPEKPTKFILLGANEYEGDITMALLEEGFQVKPIAVQKEVMELETPTRLVQYQEAGFRYALRLSVSHNYAYECVFSGGHHVIVSMSVIDIGANETLAIIKQEAPDQECPPLTPVWTLLAKELSRLWQSGR